MHQVKIVAHYGEPMLVDQCEECGGIWFDESELFRAKQGEAGKIEVLDTAILRTPSTIEHPSLICPRDDSQMHRFTDRYFPEDIVLVRCPSCHGTWLNRGIFTKYQQFVKNCFAIMPRHALHAKSLAFDHPVTKKRMSFESGLPDDMEQVLEKWRIYTSGRMGNEY